ncbi:tetratricopeptide (TPR) repeat protein [Pedobacter africanus]|uniref:Sensor histidine kinase YesM n=1 Tax=Pedobacter africanus TaxID=151894 RepID=A0ACC6KW34_9SPHI|nr:tetratricopeptide repeat protein [Pedobacter africanus]MDR6783377.1 sensor histidine kinase YesM [Pedobacter africanus]
MKLSIIILIPLLLISAIEVNGQKHGLKAIDSMKAVLKTYKTLDSARIKITYRISDAYRNIDTDSAMRYAEQGLASAKKINWPRGIAAFYDHLGSLYSNNGSYEKAIQYYKASLKINKSIANKRAEAGNIINIGSVYQRQGDDARALENSFKALAITQAIDDKGYTALLYGNISDVYFSQENFKIALSYSLKAFRTYEQLNDLSGLARSADRIGSVYLATKKLKEAEPYFQQSLKHYKELDDKMGQAKTLSHIALMHEGNANQKLEYLTMAQQLFDETNPLHPNSITNLGNIGTTYTRLFFKTKDPRTAQKATFYLKKAVAASKQVGDRDNLGYFSGELALLQENNGQYQDALLNYKKSRQISDSLYSQESKNKIASLAAQYTFRKKEETYKQQQQVSKLQMRQVYLYGALVIILVSSILIFLLNRSRIRHLRLKNEVQKKQAEEQNKELINRNKLSESELKAIRAQMNPHFIFNVLNSIESYIVENDSKTASRLVQKFASLSRLILENSTQSMVSADREWKALQLYAELEVMRFNKQFSCSFHADPSIDLSRILLPPMLVQPLIENAIHHGMRNSTAENNAITISLEQTESILLFTVEDNGIGIDEAEKFKTFSAIKSKSIGLSSIKERIEIFNVMNPEHRAQFELRNKRTSEGRGTIAKLTLPKVFREN